MCVCVSLYIINLIKIINYYELYRMEWFDIASTWFLHCIFKFECSFFVSIFETD